MIFRSFENRIPNSVESKFRNRSLLKTSALRRKEDGSLASSPGKRSAPGVNDGNFAGAACGLMRAMGLQHPQGDRTKESATPITDGKPQKR
jgi:hypothetical protein